MTIWTLIGQELGETGKSVPLRQDSGGAEHHDANIGGVRATTTSVRQCSDVSRRRTQTVAPSFPKHVTSDPKACSAGFLEENRPRAGETDEIR
jgi:hypothetical protein